jgi:geranylgeranyl diphosphate synthase type I
MGAKCSLPQSFAPYRNAVRVELENTIDSSLPSLRNLLRYHMGWQDEQGNPCGRESGKFIRSTLCVLSCQAVGGDTSQVIPAAAAVELIHNFSLIHDDIEDGSYERHHRPTVWRLWGESQAINAGDAMFTLGHLTLLKLNEKGIADEKIVSSTEMLNRACLELCEGQYLDIDYENRLDVTVKDYLDMAAKKTAALFGVSTSLGAYLGGQCSESVDFFRLFGRQLGLAYQICDDILGIWGTGERIGKSAGDISQRKKTLPVVYGLQNSGGTARKRLEELYSQKSIGDKGVSEVMEILNQLGARDYAEDLAQQYYHGALAQLEATGLEASRQGPLKETARFMLKRDF